ncbi:MAG: DUF1289 domain-containing protein [Rhodocyclaceae bacterium]|jgi:hypothetical protein|nr:DUF1289 domain-containing protein [Rhodocyclaceae bacterium]
MSDAHDDLYLCVGVCLPDEDEAYCIGCGRPWGQREHDGLNLPPIPVDAEDDEPAATA